MLYGLFLDRDWIWNGEGKPARMLPLALSTFHLNRLLPASAQRTSSLFETEWIGLIFVSSPPPPLCLSPFISSSFCSSSQCSYISLNVSPQVTHEKQDGTSSCHSLKHSPYLACQYKAAAESQFLVHIVATKGAPNWRAACANPPTPCHVCHLLARC